MIVENYQESVSVYINICPLPNPVQLRILHSNKKKLNVFGVMPFELKSHYPFLILCVASPGLFNDFFLSECNFTTSLLYIRQTNISFWLALLDNKCLRSFPISEEMERTQTCYVIVKSELSRSS